MGPSVGREAQSWQWHNVICLFPCTSRWNERLPPLGATQGELYIIDVSQSVDLDHPRALDFLREDIQHINAFFRRAGVATLTMRELYDFVVEPNVTADNIDVALQRLMTIAAR